MMLAGGCKCIFVGSHRSAMRRAVTTREGRLAHLLVYGRSKNFDRTKNKSDGGVLFVHEEYARKEVVQCGTATTTERCQYFLRGSELIQRVLFLATVLA